MEIYKATVEDIQDLVKIRLDYIQIEHTMLSAQDKQIIALQCQEYFHKHVPLTDFIAMIGKLDGTIVSAAFLVIQERPASPSFISGLTGTLLNVITYPQYRQLGFSTQIISAILAEAKKMNVSTIDLNATESGKAMYEKLGFELTDYTSMRLNLS